MMIRERIHKIFASRIFYIVFSLLASLTIWLYVAYIENPDVPWNVKDIKVEMLNKDYVTDRGLVITSVSNDKVSLKFTGKRDIVTQLNNANVTASVDLSKVTTKGVYQLYYDINYPIGVNPSSFTTTKSVNYITVTVDDLSHKEVTVRGTYDGGVAEGYQAEPIELSPTTVTVSGPQEILDKISYAWVPVHRENITKTVEDNLPFTLMDENGHEVVSNQLTFSQDTIKVVIPVVKINDVPLSVNLTYGAGADETNTVCTISPAFIALSGDAETLNNLNQISLGTIDVTKFTNTTTVVFPVVLPNDTTNLTGIKEATVTINVTGLDTTHVNTNNIQVSNVPAGYTATIVTQSFDILLRGKPEDIAKIEDLEKTTPINIRVTADLSELGATTGTYSVLAKVYIDGDLPSVGPIGDYKVTVTLTKDS